MSPAQPTPTSPPYVPAPSSLAVPGSCLSTLTSNLSPAPISGPVGPCCWSSSTLSRSDPFIGCTFSRAATTAITTTATCSTVGAAYWPQVSIRLRSRPALASRFFFLLVTWPKVPTPEAELTAYPTWIDRRREGGAWRRLKEQTGVRNTRAAEVSMAWHGLTAEFLQVPVVTRAYTAACVLTTAAVVS